METNIANLPTCIIFPVSAKHKKSEPVRKMLYQEKRNESAHFKIMRSAAEQ